MKQKAFPLSSKEDDASEKRKRTERTCILIKLHFTPLTWSPALQYQPEISLPFHRSFALFDYTGCSTTKVKECDTNSRLSGFLLVSSGLFLCLSVSLSLFDDNCLLECQLWKPVSSNRRHLSTVYDVCDTLLVKVSCRVAFIPLSILQTFPVILFTKRCVPRVKDHSLCCVIKKREDKKTLLTHLCPNGLGWRTWWRTALGFVVNTQTTSHHEKLSKLP